MLMKSSDLHLLVLLDAQGCAMGVTLITDSGGGPDLSRSSIKQMTSHTGEYLCYLFYVHMQYIVFSST